ncbi:MAG TPA: head-tail connector protein [Candidatus Paceibacterota bacterium]|nr:head-tail connector protein [Candidatus Paceibacterota bacterium]
MKNVIWTPSASVTATDVLSLSDAKLWLRVDTDDEDALITSLIGVAVDRVQNYTGYYLQEVSGTFRMDAFRNTYLPAGPMVSVSSVTYTPDATPITFSDYYVGDVGSSPYINFDSPPAIDTENVYPVTITATVGNDTPPAPLVHAVRLLLSHYYDVRESVVIGTIISGQIPQGILSLMSEYRNVYFQ